jgi:hypothetical protein
MAQTLDYDTDHGKLGMVFVLLRLKRREGLSKEETEELLGLMDLMEIWTPERRLAAANLWEKSRANR